MKTQPRPRCLSMEARPRCRQPRHLPTSDRWLAGFLCADDYARDADIPRRPEMYHVERTFCSAASGDSSRLRRG
jgi:hypothetical protein